MDLRLQLLCPNKIDIKFALAVLLGILFFLFVPVEYFALWLIVLLGFGAGILFISFAQSKEDRVFLYKIFFIAFFLRILTALFLYLLTIDWNYGLGANGFLGFFIGDGWGFHENGWRILLCRQRNLPIDPEIFKVTISASSTLHSYDFINAAIFNFTGKSPLAMFFFNSFLGVTVVILMYFIAKLIFGEKTAKVTALLCAFWPSLFLWSTQNLKEPISVFLIVVCFWGYIYFLKKFNPMYLLLFFISLLLLVKFRVPLAVIVLACVALNLLYSLLFASKKQPFLFLTICAIALLIALFFVDTYISKGAEFIIPFSGKAFNLTTLLEEVNQDRAVRAYANLSIMPDYDISNPLNLILYLPVGLTMVFFAPFPWQTANLSQIYGFFEMLAWYILIPFFIKGLYLSWKKNIKYSSILFIYICAAATSLGLTEGNIGTLFRHRAILWNFFLIFAAAGLVLKWQQRQDER